jgi:hypothetical protein
MYGRVCVGGMTGSITDCVMVAYCRVGAVVVHNCDPQKSLYSRIPLDQAFLCSSFSDSRASKPSLCHRDDAQVQIVDLNFSLDRASLYESISSFRRLESLSPR